MVNRSRWLEPHLWLWGTLAAGMLLCAAGMRMPAAMDASAPANVFAAGRALADVQLLATVQHPIGSVQNVRVLQALTSRMNTLALTPEVRAGVGLAPPRSAGAPLTAGTVHNVLGILPGKDRTLPAVLLMAHYDSVPNSPGAADDIASVAAALEVARLLRAAGPHRRDVMFLFTDGEEAGLLGAEYFFSNDPLRTRVGVAINLETRGDAGAAAMFQTGPGSGELVRLYAANAVQPYATSLSAFVYSLLRNDTDFTLAIHAGLPGLNFAFIGDQLAYHTPLATPAHLSAQSVQSMGAQVAPVALALADAAALPAPTPLPVYFDVLSRFMAVYPASAGWWPIAAAILLLLIGWRGSVARANDAQLPIPPVLRGVVTALAATLAAALACHVAGLLLDDTGYTEGYRLYRAFGALFAGSVLLAIGAALMVYGAAGRMRAVWALPALAGWLGALLPLLVAAIAMQTFAPLAAPPFAWPLLVASMAFALVAWLRPRAAGLRRPLVASLAVVSLALWGALCVGLFTAIGPGMPAVLALFVFLLLPGLAPLVLDWAGAPRALATALVLMLAGVSALAFVAFGSASAERPALAHAAYVADTASGKQWLVSTMPQAGAWERGVLMADGGSVTHAVLPPLYKIPVWQAAAKPRPLLAPAVHIERDGNSVSVRAFAADGGHVLTLYVRSSSGLVAVVVNGRASPYARSASETAVVTYAAPPLTGVLLQFAAPADAHIDVVAVEQRLGWPGGFTAASKPADIMAWQDSDMTYVSAHATSP